MTSKCHLGLFGQITVSEKELLLTSMYRGCTMYQCSSRGGAFQAEPPPNAKTVSGMSLTCWGRSRGPLWMKLSDGDGACR